MGLRLALSTLLVGLISGSAFASVQFDIGSNGVLNGLTGNRFVIGTGYGVDTGPNPENGGTLLDVLFTNDSGLPSVAFTLSPTQSTTFTFGTITFREPNDGSGGGNLGIRSQETDNLEVTAYLTFDLPPLTPGAVSSTIGIAVPGTIVDPDVDFSIIFPLVPVSFGTGGTGLFNLALSSVSFTNSPQSQDVTATLTLVNEPVPGGELAVPEAASISVWALLGTVCSFAWQRRRSFTR